MFIISNDQTHELVVRHNKDDAVNSLIALSAIVGGCDKSTAEKVCDAARDLKGNGFSGGVLALLNPPIRVYFAADGKAVPPLGRGLATGADGLVHGVNKSDGFDVGCRIGADRPVRLRGKETANMNDVLILNFYHGVGPDLKYDVFLIGDDGWSDLAAPNLTRPDIISKFYGGCLSEFRSAMYNSISPSNLTNGIAICDGALINGKPSRIRIDIDGLVTKAKQQDKKHFRDGDPVTYPCPTRINGKEIINNADALFLNFFYDTSVGIALYDVAIDFSGTRIDSFTRITRAAILDLVFGGDEQKMLINLNTSVKPVGKTGVAVMRGVTYKKNGYEVYDDCTVTIRIAKF